MACTLEELQAVEYDILCKFDDFCKEYDIKYTLAFGTLLGAIRHKGFIPWDDDVDLVMSASEFRKLKKLIRKHPIEGYDFCWIDDKKEFYNFHFAKLRKHGTYMPEPFLKDITMNHGVWIDIFVYFNKPSTKVGETIQELMFGLFRRISKKYKEDLFTEEDKKNTMMLRFLKLVHKCPDKILYFIRNILFSVLLVTGTTGSDMVRIFSWDPRNKNFNRKNIEPVTKKVFVGREFDVPVNYDDNLKFIYGPDYMTPVRFDEHADLEQIDLGKNS